MTDEQINAAIADVISPRLVLGKYEFYKSEEGWVVDCPNYCTDLNAMHEAEKTLTDYGQIHAYVDHLQNRDDWHTHLLLLATHITARQRAEAFLKALGKWEEGE
jgi:hypothetical protein